MLDNPFHVLIHAAVAFLEEGIDLGFLGVLKGLCRSRSGRCFERFFGRTLELQLERRNQGPRFERDSLGRALTYCSAQLQLGLIDQLAYLRSSRQIDRGCQRERAHMGFRGRGDRRRRPGVLSRRCGRRRRNCGRRHGCQAFGKRKPISRRKGNAPEVAGNLEFDADLKQFAHGARPLDPHHAGADGPRDASRLRMRNLQRYPHVFENVVLGLVAATVAIDDQSGGAFLKRTPQRIHAGDGERNGLHNTRAAALVRSGFAGWNRLPHHTLPKSTNQRNTAKRSGSSDPTAVVRKTAIPC